MEARAITKNLFLSFGENLAFPSQIFSAIEKERMRFYDISLASIAEVSAAIDIIVAFGYITAGTESEFQSNLNASYAMIINLRKHQSRL